jgi:hypothetical protein
MTRLSPPKMPPAYRPKWFGAVVPSSIPLSETSTANPDAVNWACVKPFDERNDR